MKKKFVNFLVILFLVCPFVVGCGCQKDDTDKTEETTKTETESKIKSVTVDDLTFHNTSIEVTEEGSTVITEVENIGSSARHVQTITLDLKDQDGNVVDTLSSYVGEEIKSGDSVATIAKTSVDLSYVTSIEYAAS